MADWLPAVLIGLAFALLILYFVRTKQAKAETYVQQPVHKGSPVDDQNDLLIAVGLQTRYVAAPSVMDKSEISTEDWIKAQARGGGIAPGPAAAGGGGGMAVTVVSTPSGNIVAAPWSGGGGGGGAVGGAPIQSSGVMLPGKAIEELVTPGQVAMMATAAAPGPAPLTAAQLAAQAAADRDANFVKQQQADALVKDATLKQSQQAAVKALKDSYVNDFQNRWLTSNDNRTNPKVTQDTPATRTAFVAWLQSKYDMDKLSFDTTMNPSETDPVKIQIRNDALAVFDNRKAAIAMLDSAWQSNSTVDCFVLPWASTSNNIADLPNDNYDVAVDCTAACGWGTMKARAKYQGPSGNPPGAACPPTDSRVTKNFNCKKAECIETRSPATAACAYSVGYEYAAANNQCVKPLTDINWTMAANGCPPPWTYDASATVTTGGVLGIGGTTVQGACKQAGRNNIAVSCAAGYKWNSDRKRCEIDPPMTPTWSCSNPTDKLTNALKPECVGQGPDPNKKGTPFLKV